MISDHRTKGTGFSDVGVWEQEEDPRRYWVKMEIHMEYNWLEWLEMSKWEMNTGLKLRRSR